MTNIVERAKRPGLPFCAALVTLAAVLLAASVSPQAIAQSATIEVTPPGTASGGSTVTVKWSGPNARGDYITVVGKGAGPSAYLDYRFTSDGRSPVNPVSIVLPAEPGAYEIRYVSTNPRSVLATVPYEVTALAVSIDGPGSVTPDSRFEVVWTGPNNPGDWVTIVAADAAPRAYGSYVDVRSGRADTKTGRTVATLRAPAKPGRYELRYVQQGARAIGKRAIEVAATPSAGSSSLPPATAGPVVPILVTPTQATSPPAPEGPRNTPGTAPPAAASAPLAASASAGAVARARNEGMQQSGGQQIVAGEVTCPMPAPSVSVNATPGAVYLTWNPLQDPAAGSTAPTYTVSRSGLGVLTPEPLRSTRFTHKTLLSYYNSATYTYTVVAQYAQGCGRSSVTVQPPRPWTPALTIRECVRPSQFAFLPYCAETEFTPRATQYLVTAKRYLELRLRFDVPRDVVPYGGDNTGWIIRGPGLAADGAYVEGFCGVISIGCEPDRNPYIGGNLDVDVGPELFPTSGEYAYTVAPVWDTPSGRFYDLNSVGRAVVRIQ
jgi:hypothetical protein